jgi:hypothetical protein
MEISPFWFNLNGTLKALDKLPSSYGGVLFLATRFAKRTNLRCQCSLSPVEKFISGVTDTGEQFITGVIDTGEQFIAYVVDTSDHIFLWCH